VTSTEAGHHPTAVGDHESAIHALSERECLSRLAAATIGRIGFVSAEGVEILPVNYRLGTGPRLFVRTQPYGIVGQLAERGARIAFEVDYYGTDQRIGWSVLMQGVLSRLDRDATVAYAELRRSVDPWPGYPDARPVAFVPRTLTGRSVHGAG
jgi:nitroimidazol reductase NimA-like FMN-containing flavoprotein (pyridoxamine 5'-phosphate oxidase superfamily)